MRGALYTSRHNATRPDPGRVRMGLSNSTLFILVIVSLVLAATSLALALGRATLDQRMRGRVRLTKHANLEVQVDDRRVGRDERRRQRGRRDDVCRGAVIRPRSEPERLAVDKLRRKGLHAIVANDISRRDIGFGSDYNAGVLLFSDGSRHELEKSTKREMADRILDLVLPKLTR